MFKTRSMLVLAILLFAQLAASLPMPSSSEPEEDNTITQATQTTTPLPAQSDAFGVSKKLLTVVYKSYSIFLNMLLQSSNQLAKDVLADPTMNNINSQDMEYEKNILKKFVKDSKEALLAVLPANPNYQQIIIAMGKDSLLHNFHSFARTRTSETEELTPEQQITSDALKRHGALEYRDNLQKRGNEFGSKLVDEFENYVKTLTPAEKEEDKEMVEAWNMYTKNETGLSKIKFGHRLFWRVISVMQNVKKERS